MYREDRVDCNSYKWFTFKAITGVDGGGGGLLLVYIVMALKLDPTLGADPVGWTNSVRSMKNESLLPSAFAGYSSIGLVGLHLRFLSADVRPRFNLSTYNLSGVAGSVGVFQQEGADQRGASRDFTIRPQMFKRDHTVFLRFSIGSLHICDPKISRNFISSFPENGELLRPISFRIRFSESERLTFD